MVKKPKTPARRPAKIIPAQSITGRKRAEEEASRMVTVVRDSNDAITIQDFEGNILAWNHGAELMYGYSEAEALKMNIWQLTPSTKEVEQRDFTRRLIAGETVTSLETQRVIKNGRILDVWLTVTKLVDDTGKPIGIASTERDITERKRAEIDIQERNEELQAANQELKAANEELTALEEELRAADEELRQQNDELIRAQETLQESEKRFRTTLDSMMEGCQIIGLDWTYRYVNDSAARHGRTTKKKLIGRTMMECYPGIERTDMFAALKRCMEQVAPQTLENEFAYPDGSSGWFELSIQPVPEGVFILSIDVTERKHAEQAMRESEVKFRILADSAYDWVYWLDSNHRFVYSSPSCLRITGYGAEEFVRDQDLFLRIIHPDDRTLMAEHRTTFLASPKDGELEYRIIRRDGTVRWIGHVCKPIISEDGKYFGRHSSNRDITKRKRAEEELRQTHEELKANYAELESANEELKASEEELKTNEEELKAADEELRQQVAELEKSREDLRASEVRYRRLFEAAKDGILILNAETGKIEDANPFIKDLLGYLREELMGKELWEIGLFNDIVANRDSFIELQKKGYIRYENLQLQTKDGRSKDVEFVSNVYSVGDQKVVQCNIRDITERKRAEEMLRAYEEFNRAIIDHSPIGTAIREKDGRLISYNKAWERIWSIPELMIDDMRREMTPALFRDIYSYVPEHLSGILTVFQHGGTYYIPEIHIETPRPGQAEWINQYFYTIQDKRGGIDKIVVLVEDITERMRAENAQRKSEEENRAIVNAVPDILFRIDGTGTILDYRTQKESQLYAPPDTFLGKKIEEVLPAYVSAPAKEAITRTLESGSLSQFEYVLDVPSGRQSFECRIVPLIGEQLLAVVRDITERKRAEEALRGSEDRYRRITEGLSDYLYTVSVQDGRAVKTKHSPACQAVTGYTAEEFAANPYLWIDMIPERERGLVAQHAKDVLSGKKMPAIEHHIVRKDGKMRWVSDVSILKYDDQGRLISYDGVIKDITERKRAEESLKQKNEELTASEEELKVVEEELRKYVEELENKQTALRESEQRLKEAQKIGRIGSWEFDVAANSIFWSEEAYSLYERDPKLGPPMPDEEAAYYTAEQTAILRDYARRAIESGESFQYDLEATLPSGKAYFSANMQPVTDKTGKVVKLRGTVQDITERKRAEEEAKRSEEFFKAVTENASDIIIIVDKKGVIKYISLSVERFLGYKPEEVIGRKAFDFVKPTDLPRAIADFAKSITTKDVAIPNAFHVRHKDGSERVFEGHGKNLFDNSAVAGFVMTGHDVTEHKRADEALRASDERLRSFVDNTFIGIYRTTPDGRILMANPALVNILGYDSFEDLARRNLEIDGYEPGYERAEFKRLMAQGDQVIGHETPWKSKDGSVIWVSENARCVRGPDKEVLYYEGTVEDITLRRTVEAEKTLVEQELRQSQKLEAIGQLAGGVAHDFNNMLAGIMGNAEMLLAKLVNEPAQARLAEQIVAGTEHAAKLTGQLLSFSRKGQMQQVPVDIHRVLGEAIGILSTTIDRRISIEQHLRADSSTVLGDPSQLENALLNLALNSRDAIQGPGRIAFSTGMVKLDQAYIQLHQYKMAPGRYIKIEVSDTGGGMDPEVQAHIFEPFFTTKEQGKGTGLGLASVYGTVKNHGGSVECYSELGHGTTMKIYLPIYKTMEKEEKVEKAEKATAGPATGRILVVDDEEIVRGMAEQILKSRGYTVYTCQNGEEALEFFKKHFSEIDLVVLDMIMPKMSGREAYLEMRKIEPGVKVLLSSGFSADGEAQEVIKLGVSGFVQKPYRVAELLKKIEEALLKKSQGKA